MSQLRTGIDSPLIEAARSGRIEDVAFLLDRGADINEVGENCGTAICWAAANGHAHVVDMLLVRGANRHIGMGPGHWAYTAAGGIEWDVLAVTRADPDVAAVWRSGGLPVERRDNYTMTELRVKEIPAILCAVADSAGPVPHSRYAELLAQFAESSDAAAVERARLGANFAAYGDVSSSSGSYLEPGATFHLQIGCPVTERFTPQPGSGVIAQTLPAFRCASVMVKGAYTQLGFAHYFLRLWTERAGLVDAARRLREVYHYYELPQSDANITELQLEIM